MEGNDLGSGEPTVTGSGARVSWSDSLYPLANGENGPTCHVVTCQELL